MRIGFKLDIGFETNQTYRELFGEKQILPFLRSIGIRAIETPIGPDSDIILFEKHLSECCSEDMICSVHPYSERTSCNPAYFVDDKNSPCRAFHEKIFNVAKQIALLQKTDVIINLHAAAAASSIPRSIQLENSILFFQWAMAWCDKNADNVKPVVELQIAPNIDEHLVRVGDGFGELYAVTEKTGCGICWDFGHAFLNLVRYSTCDIPSNSLSKYIKHVHCHDVKRDDHHALLYDSVPWKSYLTYAIENGFDGTVVIEVTPERLLSEGALWALEKSVEKLYKTIESSRR